jgi:hypothetical protein
MMSGLRTVGRFRNESGIRWIGNRFSVKLGLASPGRAPSPALPHPRRGGVWADDERALRCGPQHSPAGGLAPGGDQAEMSM